MFYTEWRLRILICCLGLLFIRFAHAQTIKCASSVPNLLTASASGTAELVGDYLLICTGGSGQVSTDVQATLNTNVATSSIALLLVDEGSGGSIQGSLTAANLVTFRNVGFAAPGTGQRILRITNLRGNALQIGVSSTTRPTQIAEFVAVSNPTIGIDRPQQSVAIISRPGSTRPLIQSVNPISAAAGGGAFPLTVNGAGFVAG